MKILLGLSGGVDSAVSAHLLKQQGHLVVGGFMKNYSENSGTCSTREDAESAIKVAEFLGIELQVFNFEKEYEEKILNYIFEGYQQGITPNPDILCNNLVKFDLFLQKALSLGFDKIATGHYARIIDNKLYRGKDYNKDQSYFLSGLTPYQLSKSIFPLGELTKTEVRKIAQKIGLPNADRKDSQGLCFVGNIPIKQFLMKKLATKIGNIVDESGTILGQHDGAWFFTIGQNRGLRLNHKAYVYKIDVKQNIVYVSKDKESNLLTSTDILVHNWKWIGEAYSLPLLCKAKIRYRQTLQECKIHTIQGKTFITFKEKQWGIAPGQTIVAYLGEECIGSGIIT